MARYTHAQILRGEWKADDVVALSDAEVVGLLPTLRACANVRRGLPREQVIDLRMFVAALAQRRKVTPTTRVPAIALSDQGALTTDARDDAQRLADAKAFLGRTPDADQERRTAEARQALGIAPTDADDAQATKTASARAALGIDPTDAETAQAAKTSAVRDWLSPPRPGQRSK